MSINLSGKPAYVQNLVSWSNLTPDLPITGPFSWTGNSGEAANVGYTFDASKSFYSGSTLLNGGQITDITSAGAKAWISQALSSWANVANIAFQINNSSPNIVFGLVEGLSVGTNDAYGAFLPSAMTGGSNLEKADVVFLQSYAGIYAYEVILHEIGHSMGLSHPAVSTYDNDSTVMANTRGAITNYALVSTPMLYDIAAAQFLYGANTGFRATDTTYNTNNFDGSQRAWTVWDAGGKDTFDVSGLSWTEGGTGAKLDLRGGVDADGKVLFSEIKNERVAIALDPATNWSKAIIIENAIGGAGKDTIIGNDANNSLYGGEGESADSIAGGLGNDTIIGGEGNDQLAGKWLFAFGEVPEGEDGVDVLVGGKGNDSLYGAEGNDKLFGGVGDDLLFVDDTNTESGNMTLLGGLGEDILYGGRLNDVVIGSDDSSQDYLHGQGGNDTIVGGTGDQLFGEAGNDMLYLTGDATSVWGGAGSDMMVVLGGTSQVVSDGTDADTVVVNPGSHVTVYATNWSGLTLKIGNQTVKGAYYSTTEEEYIANIGAGYTGTFTEDGILIEGPNTTILLAGPYDITVKTYYNEELGGQVPEEGPGVISAPQSVVIPTALQTEVNDIMDEANSLEEIEGTSAGDSLEGGAGDDILRGGAGGDTIVAGHGGGNDTYDGGTGEDWIIYPSTTLGISVNLSTGVGTGSEIDTDLISTIENIRGGSGNDTLTGDGGANKIEGKAGSDSLSGLAGNDTLWGDEGNDYASGGDGNDSLYGWLGNDTLEGDSGNDFLGGDAGNDFASGGAGNDSLYGWDGNDNLLGGDGNDTLSGEAGNDTLDGGAEKDALTGGAGADMFRFSNLTHSVGTGSMMDRITDFQKGADKIDVGSLGFTALDTDGGYAETGELRLSYSAGSNRTYVRSDITDFQFYLDGDYTQGGNLLANSDFIYSGGGGTLAGTSGADSLSGSSLNEVFYGLAGNDTLSGGAGKDTLDGGAGKDALTGGSGADVFRFSNVTDSNDSSGSTYLDRIADFVKGTDRIDISGLGFTGLETDGTSTETGELRLAYSAGSNRTYVRSDQSTFEFYLDGDFSQGANVLTNADFIY